MLVIYLIGSLIIYNTYISKQPHRIPKMDIYQFVNDFCFVVMCTYQKMFSLILVGESSPPPPPILFNVRICSLFLIMKFSRLRQVSGFPPC